MILSRSKPRTSPHRKLLFIGVAQLTIGHRRTTIKLETFCKGCRIQRGKLIPLRGPLSIPYRVFGIKPSHMNPNLCNTCDSRFVNTMKTRQITRPATILFADVRDYTPLSQTTGSQEMATLLSGFYDLCATAVWERDGIINKMIGDAIFAVFNFPITREDHIECAVDAGMEILEKCKEMKITSGLSEQVEVGIGVGIHTGDVSVGDIGSLCKDFTVIGEVVNMSSRLQGAAKPGELALSEAIYEKVNNVYPGIEPQAFDLKGIDRPVTAYVLAADQRVTSGRQNG